MGLLFRERGLFGRFIVRDAKLKVVGVHKTIPLAATPGPAPFQTLLYTKERLLVIALVLVFLDSFLRVEILQQNGQKQVEHDQVHADVEHREKEQR